MPLDRSPARVPALTLFVILAVLQFTAGQVAQLYSAPLGLLFTEVVLFAAPALLVLRASNLRASFLQPRLPSAKVLVLVIALGAANFPLAGGMASATRALDIWPAELLRLAEIAEHILLAQHGVWRVLVIVAACLAAPVCEELAFRGVMQPSLAARWGYWPGLLVTAGLFSLLHANPILMPALFELGLVFGLVASRTASLPAAMLAHAMHNSITTVLLYTGTAETFEPQDMGGALRITAVGAVLTVPLLVALWKATEASAKPVPDAVKVEPEQPVRFRPRRVVLASVAWALLLGASLAGIVLARR